LPGTSIDAPGVSSSIVLVAETGTDRHGAMHVALRSLRLHGMTAAEVLGTATALPARAWGLDSDLGTVQPGRIADLAFVEGGALLNLGAPSVTSWCIVP
jgi:imidazolonepropionase-like amidohydrolase